MTEQELFHELSFYTLEQPRPPFIHQIALDTFTAQCADAATRPQALMFALAGLYLHTERGYSGLAVQKLHMQLARKRRQYPGLALPPMRGTMRVADVLAVTPGPTRDAAIEQWCASVWAAYRENRTAITDFLRREPGIG